jgi:NADPH:quinone reductase-like Zn-dependent oxidoreductase
MTRPNHAGSGGVGTFIQIAKHPLAHMSPMTVSAGNVELVKKSSGQTRSITRRQFEDEIHDFDLVPRHASVATHWNALIKTLKKGGTIVSIKGADTGPCTETWRSF